MSLQHWGVRGEMKKWSSGECFQNKDSELDGLSMLFQEWIGVKSFRRKLKLRAMGHYGLPFPCHPVFIVSAGLRSPTRQGQVHLKVSCGHSYWHVCGWGVLRWSSPWEHLLAGRGVQGWGGPEGDSTGQEDWKGPKPGVSLGAELRCWKRTRMPSRNPELRTSPADLTDSSEMHVIHGMRKC